MSRWFRTYDDIINDPKILILSEGLRWIWIAMLCIASKNGGTLPGIDIIALSLRVKRTKAAEYLTQLVTAGLIDNDDGVFSPHNWSGRQYKTDTGDETAAERMRRYRDRKRNERNGDGSVTGAREQITDTQTQKEKKKTRASALVDDDWPANFEDLFWQAYPRRTEKTAAMRKLAVVRKSGLTFTELIAGVERYAALVANTDPKYIKQPTTWLNAGCWADEIPQGGFNGHRTGNPRQTGHDAILAVALGKARELDRNDELAGTTAAAGPAVGDGIDRGGPRGNPGPAQPGHRDHHGIEPDSQRIREGEIIPPDKNAAGVPGRGELFG